MSDHLENIAHDARPWGAWRRFAFNEQTTVKIITVSPGGVLSLQRHEHRDELWHVLDDGLQVQIGDQITDAVAGDEFVIMRGQTHRLRSIGPGGRVLEVAFGTFDEDDIERLADDYGRA